MTDPPRPARGDSADAPPVEPRREAVTLVAPDGSVVQGVLWSPPAGRWHTAVALTHHRADAGVDQTCAPLAAAGLAVLAFTPRDVDHDTGCPADVEAVVAHLRALGSEAVVHLGVPDLRRPTADPVLVAATSALLDMAATRTEGRGGRGQVLGVAAGIGVVVGIGLAVATGVLVWPLVGAVAGVGVGDLVAGGRR